MKHIRDTNHLENTQITHKNHYNIHVIIRTRPLTSKEIIINPQTTIKIINNQNLILLDHHEEENEKKTRTRENKFSFDQIYDINSSTKQIYDKSISSLLDGLLNGYNSSIIAYGATGCGKTYTMIGQQGKQGIFALSMIDLLGRANHQRNYKNINIKLSYIEIYNQIIKDLLISEDKNLEIREDSKQGVQIIGATEIFINSMIQLNIVLKVGSANRSKDSTVSNEISSRSHAILMIKIQSKDKQNNSLQQRQISIGKLLLVDLAGSQKTSWQKGSKQIEGSKINRSLLTLGNCIQILAESNGKIPYIPYRESKLTRLLKQSLGGNCRTTMIVNISPFTSHWQQTFNSLLYGSRASNIKTSQFRVVQSEVNNSNYTLLIHNLKRQNEDLKKQLKSNNKNKNNSLPQLKLDPQANLQEKQADKVKININKHFQEELKIIKIINQLTIKIDKLAFNLFSIQIDSKSNKFKSPQKHHKKDDKRIKQNKLKNKIGDLSRQRRNFEQKLEQIVLERDELVYQIKSSQFNENIVYRLMSQYRQKKIQLQLQEIKLRQKRIENEHREKELFLKELRQEVEIRDKIIEQQKILIQKNNIINRITYSKINFGEKEEEIPHLIERLNIKKSILPQQHKQSDQNSFEKDKPNYKQTINKSKQKINKIQLLKARREKSTGTILKNNLIDESIMQNLSKRQRVKKNRGKVQDLNFISLQR